MKKFAIKNGDLYLRNWIGSNGRPTNNGGFGNLMDSPNMYIDTLEKAGIRCQRLNRIYKERLKVVELTNEELETIVILRLKKD